MAKWVITIFAALLLIQIGYAITTCQISTDNATWTDISSSLYGGCTDSTNNLAYIQNLEENEKYYIRCKNDTTDWGYISQKTTVSGEVEGMTTGIILFLLLLNIGVFTAPFFVKHFSKNEVTDYIVKRMLWMAGIIILWFNTLIFRTMAESFELGIDSFLEVYWWFFTLGMFIVIFLSMYFMIIGAIKLAHQTRIAKRMGNDEKY